MNLTLGSRISGKTTKLIKQSAETGIYILVKNRKRAEIIAHQAKELGYDIPYPITLTEWFRSSDKFIGSCIERNGIYVDDGDAVLEEIFYPLDIHEVTLTSDEKTQWLKANPHLNKKESDDE